MIGYRLASCYATSIFASCVQEPIALEQSVRASESGCCYKYRKIHVNDRIRNLWLISKTELEFAYRACTFLIKRKKKDEEHQ